MSGLIRDTNLKVTKALPAAAATNYTDAIDLIDSAPGIKMRNAQLEVVIPDLPALIDAKTYTGTLQDSADGETFAAIPTLAPIVITGVDTPGADGVTRLFKCPEDIRRYVRLKQDVLTGGGDNTAVSATLSVVY